MKNKKTILYAEDNQPLREMMRDFFEQKGYTVLVAENGKQALKILSEEKIHLLVTDLDMPEMDGLILTKKAYQLNPDMPTIVLTGLGTIKDAIEVMKHGAVDFLAKPAKPEYLLQLVELHLQRLQVTKYSEKLPAFLTKGNVSYTLPAQEYLFLPVIVWHIANLIKQFGYIDATVLQTVKTLLHEVLTNAMYHGTLGVESKGLRDKENGGTLFMEEIVRRALSADYANKSIRIAIDMNETQLVVEIADDGLGFDWKQKLQNAQDPKSFLLPYGRGLSIATGLWGEDFVMNEAGNVVTLHFKKEKVLK